MRRTRKPSCSPPALSIAVTRQGLSAPQKTAVPSSWTRRSKYRIDGTSTFGLLSRSAAGESDQAHHGSQHQRRGLGNLLDRKIVARRVRGGTSRALPEVYGANVSRFRIRAVPSL